MPYKRLWIPPLLLGALGLLFGIFPVWLESPLLKPVVASLINSTPDFHLQLWHGLNLILLLSAITIGGGTALYFLIEPSKKLFEKVTRFEAISPRSLVLMFSSWFQKFSGKWTGVFQNGFLRYYLITILLFLTALLAYKLYQGVNIYPDFSSLTRITIYEAVTLFIMSAAIFYAVFTKSRLVAVASMGVVGYAICLIFLFYSAPDLAMTQFSIDTLTVILFVLVLYNLPKYLQLSDTGDRLRDGALALIFGALISILALEVLNETPQRQTSEYYAENAYTLAHGKNVVNVILVDFRGFDTMVEITVLTIAALGVFSLLKLRLKNTEKE